LFVFLAGIGHLLSYQFSNVLAAREAAVLLFIGNPVRARYGHVLNRSVERNWDFFLRLSYP
jgi:hypothetical protein